MSVRTPSLLKETAFSVSSMASRGHLPPLKSVPPSRLYSMTRPVTCWPGLVLQPMNEPDGMALSSQSDMVCVPSLVCWWLRSEFGAALLRRGAEVIGEQVELLDGAQQFTQTVDRLDVGDLLDVEVRERDRGLLPRGGAGGCRRRGG